MKAILAIDLGKSKSVFCKMDTIELKLRFFTLKTSPQKFHDVFVELNGQDSIVLFEVGAQSGWLSDMLRLLGIEFKVANVNHPSWKWSNNPNKVSGTNGGSLRKLIKEVSHCRQNRFPAPPICVCQVCGGLLASGNCFITIGMLTL